jgi:hypothetical protein
MDTAGNLAVCYGVIRGNENDLSPILFSPENEPPSVEELKVFGQKIAGLIVGELKNVSGQKIAGAMFGASNIVDVAGMLIHVFRLHPSAGISLMWAAGGLGAVAFPVFLASHGRQICSETAPDQEESCSDRTIESSQYATAYLAGLGTPLDIAATLTKINNLPQAPWLLLPSVILNSSSFVCVLVEGGALLGKGLSSSPEPADLNTAPNQITTANGSSSSSPEPIANNASRTTWSTPKLIKYAAALLFTLVSTIDSAIPLLGDLDAGASPDNSTETEITPSQGVSLVTSGLTILSVVMYGLGDWFDR